MVRDFSVDNTFLYTPTRQEGTYQIVVTARNNTTGNVATSRIARFKFTSLVVGSAPAITPTANPMVALFSSPPGPAGAVQVRASILQSGFTLPSYTNWQACKAGQNVNLLIAGMHASSTDNIRIETSNGSTNTFGPALPFTTGAPTLSLPVVSVVTPLTSQDNQSERFILLATIAAPPLAVDLGGRPVWYYVDPSGPSHFFSVRCWAVKS